MDSQDESYREPPTSPAEFEAPVDFPQGIEDGVFHHPALQGQGEPLAPPHYTAAWSPPTYEATEIRHAHETEAQEVLCSQQFQLIQCLLRFGLYGEKASLCHTLQHYETYELDNILVLLKDDEQHLAELEKDQKVNEILELVGPIRTFSHVSWRWAPFTAADMDAEQIAASIDEESYSLFRKVRFEDWVRHFAGYEEESVNRLFLLHGVLTRKICCHLLIHGDEREKYIQVEEVSRLSHGFRLF